MVEGPEGSNSTNRDRLGFRMFEVSVHDYFCYCVRSGGDCYRLCGFKCTQFGFK